MYKTMQALKQNKEKHTPPNCIVATSQKRMRYWWDLIESNKLNTWQVEKAQEGEECSNEIQNCYKILPLTDQRPCHKAFNESQ